MPIHESWRQHIPLIRGGYHDQLLTTVDALRANATIYPPSHRVFFALEATPFSQVKAVIVGQDPYHGAGQAHGLAFSVPEGIKAPPSLRNIFKEIEADIYAGAAPHFSTDLTRWARQGVLLLNASLTVEAGKAGSHQQIGWHRLTDQILLTLSQEREHLVFMLWGRHAQLKKELLDGHRHCILEAPHPSPLSAYRGFLGCRHFSKANHYMVAYQQTPVAW
ncbi:MAG: uracil-DNA glycosylase [Anaerolineales bacterium]|nr:MAG: uracil-DNA glycosylase [Anaerolineales bacterium]